MIKMQSVRVIVPCDDDVSVAELQQFLIETLQPLPLTRVPREVEGVPLSDVTWPGGRIHWSAVSVVRGLDRSEAPAIKRTAAPRRTPPP
jgi:hypothetical protein